MFEPKTPSSSSLQATGTAKAWSAEPFTRFTTDTRRRWQVLPGGTAPSTAGNRRAMVRLWQTNFEAAPRW